MKEFFTLSEATEWFSRHSDFPLSKDDLLRFNEEGCLPICFKYKGFLGVFPAYRTIGGILSNSIIFPKPIQRIYFYGYLKSLNSCRPGVVTEHIREGGRVRLIEKADILSPHKVELKKILYADSALSSVNVADGFWGRVRESDGSLDHTSTIPESEWCFHVDGLKIMVAREQQEAQQRATTGCPASANDLAFGSNSIWSDEKKLNLLSEHQKLKTNRVNAPTKELAAKHGISEKCIRGHLAKARTLSDAHQTPVRTASPNPQDPFDLVAKRKNKL